MCRSLAVSGKTLVQEAPDRVAWSITTLSERRSPSDNRKDRAELRTTRVSGFVSPELATVAIGTTLRRHRRSDQRHSGRQTAPASTPRCRKIQVRIWHAVCCPRKLEEDMQRPLRIISRDFSLSEAFEAEIRQKAAGLASYYPRMSGCEVTVRAPALKHHRKGGPFIVNIRMTVPGRELAVDRQSEEELSQAIREAFDVARRQLEDYAREQRGDVKAREHPALGRVVRIERQLGYGFLEADDGREVYFHRNSVIGGGFDKLEVGARVRFAEEEGDKGPQATTLVEA